MKSFYLLMVVLLLPAITLAETYTMTLKADPPLLFTDGNPVEPRDIIGYRYFISLDVPFADLAEFDGEPVQQDVVWDLTTGEVIDDATELVLTYEFPDEPANHTIYATVIVEGWAGDSAALMPIREFSWTVADAPLSALVPPGDLYAVAQTCETGSWRTNCILVASDEAP